MFQQEEESERDEPAAALAVVEDETAVVRSLAQSSPVPVRIVLKTGTGTCFIKRPVFYQKTGLYLRDRYNFLLTDQLYLFRNWYILLFRDR